MKLSTLKIVLCPYCYSNLDLASGASKVKGVVVKGKLSCAKERFIFDIGDGIPLLLKHKDKSFFQKFKEAYAKPKSRTMKRIIKAK